LDFENSANLLVLIASMLLLAVTGVAVLRRRSGRIERVFGLLLLVEAVWLLLYVFQLASNTTQAVLIWHRIEYVAILAVPLLWFAFVVAYSGYPDWLQPRRVAVWAALPTITAVLALTNDLHHLLWRSLQVVILGGLHVVVPVYGPWAPVQLLYAVGISLIAAGLLARRLGSGPLRYRFQIALILVAWVLPTATAIYDGLTHQAGIAHQDLGPYAFALASLFVAGSVYGFRFTDVVPQARDKIFESLGDGILVLDSANRIVDFNPSAIQLIPPLKPGSLGKQAEEVFAGMPDLVERFREVSVARTEIVGLSVEDPHYFELTLTPLDERRGVRGGRMIVVRDITRRFETAEQIRKLSQAVEQSANIILISDTEGIIEYVNQRFVTLTGYSREEAIGQHTRLQRSGESPREVYEDLWTMIKGGRQWRGEFHNRKKNGEFYWVDATISPIMNDSGQITHFLAIEEDITERKRIEEAEAHQHRITDALREIAASLSGSLDLDAVLAQVLDSVERTIGVPYDMAHILLIEDGVAQVAQYRIRPGFEETGQSISPIALPVEETRSLREVVASRQALVIPDVREYEGWVPLAARPQLRSIVCAPIQVGDDVIGFLNLDSTRPQTFSQDHAHQVQLFADQVSVAIRNAQLYEQAQTYAASLEARNRELDAFSFTVAHDLRAPLNLITGYLSLIEMDEQAGALDPELVGFLKEIKVGAGKMNDIIEGLLLLARLYDDDQVLGPVVMDDVVLAAISRFRTDIEARHVQVDVDRGLPAVQAQPLWMEEVVANLIGNAIKYIGRGNAAPRIAIAGRPQDGMARFEVTDNGVGIAPEDQERLFQMFSRFHESEARGFGLGLSIVLRIVHRLGGQVGVESAPGQGSTFWFTVPLPDDLA
jgi:PAS domain S-box-containing protein